MIKLSKIGILFILLSAAAPAAWSQSCTPDNTITASQGVFPSSLPPATINENYSQVIQIKAPKDTTVYVAQVQQNVNVKIDSMRVLSVTGLPPGFSYQCYSPTCTVLGGEVTCVSMYGVCATTGHYPLKVAVKSSGRAQFGVLEIPQSQIDTNYTYYIDVNWHTGFANIGQALPVNVYPNPAQGNLNIDLNGIGQGEAAIYDVSGRQVWSNMLNGETRLSVGTGDLSKGIYLLHIRSAGKVYQSRFRID